MFTIRTAKPRQQIPSDVYIVNFERISRIVLVFLLLNLNKQMFAEESCSLVPPRKRFTCSKSTIIAGNYFSNELCNSS